MQRLRYVIVICLISLVVTLFVYGIPQDAWTAYHKTCAGDRMRLFHYEQSARWEGVPTALARYGLDLETQPCMAR